MVESSFARIRRRKAGKHALSSINTQRMLTCVVHYSCETFRPNGENSGKSRRTTSIAIRNLSSGVTESFSIHQYAEKMKIMPENLERSYDRIEKKMLSDFFKYAKDHPDRIWMHWNMRDINYGFAALEHRAEVLQTKPFKIAEEKRFDLARILVDVYGIGYIGHPRMQQLMQFNNITSMDFLGGEDEAAAFESKEFVKLHLSTLRKVDVICGFFDRAYDDTLKVKSSYWEIHGVSIAAITQTIKEHPIYVFLILVASILGAIAKFTDVLKNLST